MDVELIAGHHTCGILGFFDQSEGSNFYTGQPYKDRENYPVKFAPTSTFLLSIHENVGGERYSVSTSLSGGMTRWILLHTDAGFCRRSRNERMFSRWSRPVVNRTLNRSPVVRCVSYQGHNDERVYQNTAYICMRRSKLNTRSFCTFEEGILVYPPHTSEFSSIFLLKIVLPST